MEWVTLGLGFVGVAAAIAIPLWIEYLKRPRLRIGLADSWSADTMAYIETKVVYVRVTNEPITGWLGKYLLRNTANGTLPRPLANGTINKTIRLLAAIMEDAVDADLVPKNPAAGKKRLLSESKPSRSHLQPEQVAALLDAAGALDAAAREGDTGRRRPLLAVLALAGLRIGEALELRWRDVNLGAGRLRVVASKTSTGIRDVDLSPALREILSEYRIRAAHTAPGDYVFATGSGKLDGAPNVRRRFLAPAVAKANEALDEAGGAAIEGVSPHGLRRTFISLLAATNAPIPYVMAQVGHADPKMTLGVYAGVIDSGNDHGAALDGLIGSTTNAGQEPIAEPA